MHVEIRYMACEDTLYGMWRYAIWHVEIRYMAEIVVHPAPGP